MKKKTKDKKVKPVPIDQPTRRTVELLLRETIRDPAGKAYEDFRQASSEYDAAVEALLAKSAKIRRLAAKRDRLDQTYHTLRDVNRDKVRRVRQLYLATGLTPRVRRELAKLVNILNR